MTLKDIINPWGALKRERDLWRTALRGMHRRAATEEKVRALTVRNLKAEIKRLEKIIADGHYRDPKTGRLGRKGEVFTK
jgi:phage host-nuclease inhibitor protein Gam